MKLIVCPTDFSSNASNAILYASAMGSAFKSRIILVHAYESPVMFSEVPMTSILTAEKQIRDACEKKLKTLIAKLEKQFKEVSYEYMIVQGLPHEQVTDIASKNTADLIVMGATGTSKLGRMLMGSTTGRVIRDAHCPVLSIPKDARYTGIKNIVFATDLNEDNISSAATLSGFARSFDAQMNFLFVDDKHLLHSDEEIDRMTQKIRKRVKYPKIAGYISKNTSVTTGIDYFLKKKPADMLVMFTHSRHFPGSFFNQSLTKLMSHQSRIPLLALKHEDRPVMP